jgi:predicted Rossmann fold nucleotide-binding protein DprA/Smf involved in DNA uptake
VVESHKRINREVYSPSEDIQEEKHSINKVYIKQGRHGVRSEQDVEGGLEVSNSNKTGNQDTNGKLQKDCNNSNCKRSTCQKCPGNNGNTPHVCEECCLAS